MNHTTSCIRCNTPYLPGSHYCHICGFPHDRPDPGPSLEILAGREPDLVLRPAPGDKSRPLRKPSLPLAVLALLFPKALDK